MAALETRVRERAAETGAALGVAAADAFRVIVIDEDEEDEGPDLDVPVPPSDVAG